MPSYLKLNAVFFIFAKHPLLVPDLCKISVFTAQFNCKTKATVWFKMKQYYSAQ